MLQTKYKRGNSLPYLLPLPEDNIKLRLEKYRQNKLSISSQLPQLTQLHMTIGSDKV